jgi:hypothetical protein
VPQADKPLTGRKVLLRRFERWTMKIDKYQNLIWPNPKALKATYLTGLVHATDLVNEIQKKTILYTPSLACFKAIFQNLHENNEKSPMSYSRSIRNIITGLLLPPGHMS